MSTGLQSKISENENFEKSETCDKVQSNENTIKTGFAISQPVEESTTTVTEIACNENEIEIFDFDKAFPNMELQLNRVSFQHHFTFLYYQIQ